MGTLVLSSTLAILAAQNTTGFYGKVGGQTKSWVVSHNGPAPASDADHNGLKDSWETFHFGHTGVDPNGDPDNDGRTNAQEMAAGSDPQDFFNGERPVLVTVSGTQQAKASGYLPQPAVIQVYHANGTTPWPGAPVRFTVQTGFGRWAAAAGDQPSAELTVMADSAGQARAYYWMP
jgi:hypothetical protein